MKKFIYMALATITLVACTTVESGSAGVPVSWGGKTGTEVVDEGVNYGLNYLVDDVVEYSVREQTITLKKRVQRYQRHACTS